MSQRTGLRKRRRGAFEGGDREKQTTSHTTQGGGDGETVAEDETENVETRRRRGLFYDLSSRRVSCGRRARGRKRTVREDRDVRKGSHQHNLVIGKSIVEIRKMANGTYRGKKEVRKRSRLSGK